ncbi:YesL family protein [Lederbergia panacisoli]|uniref:YesL family protein n=1 Tax=Lederbergia panacisoli TaxID=1255251 RepID=UPI00214CC7CC|nr:DUF624 domain-containing protein [Lederbergia panacisoli]MCR2821535.1 DUF624 domain-containing protein [Lederbergia panacisoli]
MRVLNSWFFDVMETISNFFLLNILWILFSLPIVTIFPSTTAMFAIIRDWKIGKNRNLFSSFTTYFKQYFQQSFSIGFIFIICVGIIFLDFLFIDELSTFMRVLVFSLLLMIGFIQLFISIYLFPIMVHFELPLKTILKNALFYSFMYFPTTLLSILFIAAIGLLLFLIPIFSIIAFSVTAYTIHLLCYRQFNKTVARQAT